MPTVIAAIDLGPSTGRVLRHAAGMARILDAQLRVMHVTADPSSTMEEHVRDECRRLGPYELDPDTLEVAVRTGRVSEAIYREAKHENAVLVVMGSRGRSGITHLLLGSTTAAVLENAPAAVLLVPPIDLDIVNISDQARLTCGPVIAAVDVGEESDQQLRFASQVAGYARQPLLLMTVASRGVDDHLASAILRERAHAVAIKPHAMIVRRGSVPEEISLCAKREGAGLVVMGLRAKGRGRPGAIASAVLATRRAFVMAVPA